MCRRAVLAILMLFPSAGLADETYSFVSFMCREDLGYLGVEPVTLFNPKDSAALADPDLVSIFGDRDNTPDNAPLRSCRIKLAKTELLFSLHSVWRRPPTLHGVGGALWNEGFTVRLNGLPLAEFIVGSRGSPFSMTASGWLTICLPKSNSGTSYELVCDSFLANEWFEAPVVYGTTEWTMRP